MPTISVITCLTNSASVKESTSCNCEISEVSLLVSSPTRLFSKKLRGRVIILLYTAIRISYMERSLTLAKRTTRQKENML